jgi:hypothetical protein
MQAASQPGGVLPASGHLPPACVAWSLRQLIVTGQRGVGAGTSSMHVTLTPLATLCPSLASATLTLLDPEALPQFLAVPHPTSLSHLEVRLAATLAAPMPLQGRLGPGPSGFQGLGCAGSDLSPWLAVQSLTGLVSLRLSDGAGLLADDDLVALLAALTALTSLTLDGCRWVGHTGGGCHMTTCCAPTPLWLVRCSLFTPHTCAAASLTRAWPSCPHTCATWASYHLGPRCHPGR